MVIKDGVLEKVEESDIVDGKFVVPEEVTSIGDRAFFDCKSLTEINLPEGVTSIKRDTFAHCDSLTKINLPEGVTSIENSAFYGCESLTEINLPESVTSIGLGVFRGCSSLTEMNIPAGVTSIKGETFAYCDSLTKINLPEGVTSIEDSAFYDCKSLTEINLPESVTSIGAYAFEGCSSLTKTNIPAGVTSIEEGTFKGCENLTGINIPAGVTRIGGNAFGGCSSLTETNLPESVTRIGAYAFGGCSSLTKTNIPEGVTSIVEGTFDGCENLTEINLPERLTSIEKFAFYGCRRLKQIDIPEGVTSIEKRAFYECSSLTKTNIPAGVTSIGEGAFEGCYYLTEINLPERLTSIEERAFYNCINLILSNIPQALSNSSLQNLLRDGVITVQDIFGEFYDKIEQIKTKANFHLSQDFSENDMNVLYYSMLRSIGSDEIERIVEIPNLTSAEIEEYTLEKDEAFNALYDTKYQLSGDLGVTLELLKKLDLSVPKKPQDGKNTQEMKLFKSLNQKLEEGYKGSLTNLVSLCLREHNMEVEPEWLEQIQDFERSMNKAQINETLQAMDGKIGEVLGTPTENYPEAIVPLQIQPVQAMIEDVIRNLFRDNGQIDLRSLKQALDEKIGNAHAPYIVQHKEQIVEQALGFLQKDETFQKGIEKSPLNALKTTKEKIGGAWKYKLNTTLKEMGYSFSSLPSEFTKEEIEKLSELMGEKLENKSVSILKEGADREEAYKLLEEKDLPKLVTYKQLHDMFFSIHPPYSEEFKEYFKQHREEFWETPEYYGQFGRIHNNFEAIIQDPILKNIYAKGELSVGQIIGYLKEKTFATQRPGDEKLAQLASGVGTISTDEEFAKVQEVFDITRRRERTSIPPTTVTNSKFRGRMLAPDDVLNLFAGDITTCCQKFNDVGEGSVLLGSIEENGGIFVVEELDENGKPTNIIGQSLTIRQKGKSGGYDRLTFDNIEITNGVKSRLSKEEHAEILELYKQAGKQAIEKDKKFLQKQVKAGKITEEQYDSLVLKEVIAGTGYNDLNDLYQQPDAEIVVPDEARNTYHSIKGQAGHAWIDSTGGQAPMGSDKTPVILATMEEEELAEIEKRKIDNQWKVKIKPKEVPLWYGKVGEVETLSDEQITPEKIEKIKLIERIAFREEQQLLNNTEAETPEEMIDLLTDMDDVEKFTVKLGSNEDWFVSYAENETEVEISCLAAVGGMHAEQNGTIPKANFKLATAESSNEMYGILLEAVEKDKQIYCDATADTSLINLKNMLKKGLIQLKDLEGRDICYKDKELVYGDTEEMVEYRDWEEDSDISMLRLEIIPDAEKIKEEKAKSEKWLEKAQETIRMAGSEKEQGLDEMRNQIREEWQEKDDAK